MIFGAYNNSGDFYDAIGNESYALSQFIQLMMLMFGTLVLANMIVAMLCTRYDEILESGKVGAELNYAALIEKIEKNPSRKYFPSLTGVNYSYYEGQENGVRMSRAALAGGAKKKEKKNSEYFQHVYDDMEKMASRLKEIEAVANKTLHKLEKVVSKQEAQEAAVAGSPPVR